MSNKNQETIADIVDAMRNEGHTGEASCLEWIRTKMTYYADRIEAAAKREHEATREKSSQVGNAAKVRDACSNISEYAKAAECHTEDTHLLGYLKQIERWAEAALSAPLRNCDIMDWRTAWAKWRTEIYTQTPCGYAEVFRGTEKFMDWYMSEARGDAK